jgi:hypothetical protein
MPYRTISDFAPSNLTGVSSAYITRIPHNPYHPLSTTIGYPDQYDELVSKIDEQMTPSLVEDEDWAVADILTGNWALYLNHRPRYQTEISVSSGVVGLKDYEHGIIYFNELPTGNFTVQYLAEPDKYYAEYLQVVQDVVHKIQWLLGAGPTLNEGIKNAEMFLDTLPAGLQARLPNAIHIRAIDRDIEIRSSTDESSPNGTSHRITFGNGDDEVFVDASRFIVHRSILSGPDPTYINIRLGDETGDFCSVAGDLDVTGRTVIGTRGTSANTGVPDSAVTGFQATGAPYTGNSLKLAVHGDAVVYGDLHVLGQQISYNVTRNIQVNVFEENLEVGNDLLVQGHTRLGVSTSQHTQISGNLDVTGETTLLGAGGTAVNVDTSIVFHDGALKGPFQQNLVDGLDPSYMELSRPLMRAAYKTHHHNDALRSFLYQGTTTSSSDNDQLIDTSTSSLTGLYPGGTYYPSKFDDGDFYAVVNNQRIPIKSFNPSTKVWTLSRTVDGLSAISSGTGYQIYHRRGHGDFIQAGVGLSVTIRGTSTFPFVGNANGTVKKRTSDYTLAVPASSTVYIFMSTLVGVNGIDQDAPTFFYKTLDIEDDRSVLIGKVVTNGSAPTSIVCYDINAEYDTLWVKFDTSATGNTQAAGSDYTFTPYLGNVKRRMDARVMGLIAPNTGSQPDLTNMAQISFDSSLYVKKVLGESVVVKTSSGAYQGISLPYWVRMIVT